ncbi:MAG: mechanosensitive ion channel family protein, partial [Terriglobia bacterium]
QRIVDAIMGALAQAVPALVVLFGVGLVPALGETLSELIRNLALAYLALMVTLAVAGLLSAANAIYSSYPVAKDRPIKGFVQVAKIVVYILGGVVVVSFLMAKSPVVLLTGFGAMTAILLLVFKDTILSLVASIQLTGLDMVRVGDWIEMPQYNADGDVVDVALHTVKVQNWDKTITTIPTHKLISESFKNWRGMSESGGRRIKRSINVDINSVRFLTDEEVEKFKQFKLLEEYIKRKHSELDDYNAKLGETANVNLRRLTNLGTFRAYLYNYLRNHPQIHHGMTLLVRQLQAGETGIPIEIYCFTNTTDWSDYESIQADIFDHILAQSRDFGIKVFQAPSGSDVMALRETVGD